MDTNCIFAISQVEFATIFHHILNVSYSHSLYYYFFPANLPLTIGYIIYRNTSEGPLQCRESTIYMYYIANININNKRIYALLYRCFLLLLLLAAVLWKIKQKYDMFRRRQRLFVEMEQMASRPFSEVSHPK